MYVRDISTGITVSDCEPSILTERAATAHVDGCNLLGPVVGDFSMQLAISKAKTAGVALVTAKSWSAFFLFYIQEIFCCTKSVNGKVLLCSMTMIT